MQALVKALKGKPITLFGVLYKDKPEAASAFVKSKGLTYPTGVDADGAVASQFGVRGTPTVVLVDRKGVVRYQGGTLPDMKTIQAVLK